MGGEPRQQGTTGIGARIDFDGRVADAARPGPVGAEQGGRQGRLPGIHGRSGCDGVHQAARSRIGRGSCAGTAKRRPAAATARTWRPKPS